GMPSRKPHRHDGRQRDHRRRPSASAATAPVSVALSTAPVIRIRVPVANSSSMVPPPANAAGKANRFRLRDHYRRYEAHLLVDKHPSAQPATTAAIAAATSEMPYRPAVADI